MQNGANDHCNWQCPKKCWMTSNKLTCSSCLASLLTLGGKKSSCYGFCSGKTGQNGKFWPIGIHFGQLFLINRQKVNSRWSMWSALIHLTLWWDQQSQQLLGTCVWTLCSCFIKFQLFFLYFSVTKNWLTVISMLVLSCVYSLLMLPGLNVFSYNSYFFAGFIQVDLHWLVSKQHTQQCSS